MKIRRTANAGVLLELDGVSILLDGVCREVKPYPATPPEERQRLLTELPDIVAFSHIHKDHYDPAYAAEYMRQSGRVILGPEGVRGGVLESYQVGDVCIKPVPCRHIGAAGKDTPHSGFVINGSKCVWFTGDSSPLSWKNREDIQSPDIMFVPYAYLNTESSWNFTKSTNAKIVLLHMPDRNLDPVGLWDSVENIVGNLSDIYIPDMLESIDIN